MAKEEQFSFTSKDGKTRVHAVRWLPEQGEIRAVLQITHGMVEYIERYRPFAEFLTGKGFLVVGHDHIGHGESVATREDWGYFASRPSDTLVADMHRLRKLTVRDYPNLPYFILGHSMGSYLLRKYLTIFGEGLQGAIVMGTGCVKDGTVRMGMGIARLQAALYGWRHRSRLLQRLSYDKPYKKYDTTGRDRSNSWLTKDVSVVETYHGDPKCSFVFTLNGYMGLFEAVLYDNQPGNIAKMPKELPIFLVSGEEDPVGNLGKGVRQVYDKFKEAGVKDVTLKLYKDDRHEILNETDREVVYEDLVEWLKERCAGGHKVMPT